MTGRPKGHVAAVEDNPGGRYVCTESARVVREQLESSIGSWVTISVNGAKSGTMTVFPHNVGRTTAVCRVKDGPFLMVMLGEKDEEDKQPVILLGTLIPDAR